MIKISGNSNYNVMIVEYENHITILKESNSKEDTIRLKNQIKKHEYFLKFFKKYVPNIIKKEDNNYIIEYIKSYDMINYLDISEIYHIQNYISEIINLIHQFITESKLIIIKKDSIIQKLNMIQYNLKGYEKDFLCK